jgi:hypothetical protein
LNEPNWNFVEDVNPNGCDDVDNTPLKDLYDQIIPAIRVHDKNHMLLVEGNCWANNHRGIWPLHNENNAVLSFHRYWVDNDVSSIQQYLDLQKEHNIPLWVGETGENSDEWYQQAVALLESYDIGWAWWTWKKMESSSGVFSIKKPDGYQDLLDYWAEKEGAVAPDPQTALQTMLQVAENVRLENSKLNYGAIEALTAHVLTCDDTSKVADLSSTVGEPVRIEAEQYCRNSGFLSESTQDVGGGANIGFTGSKDIISYQVNVPANGLYKATYRYAGFDGGLALQSSLSGHVGMIRSLSSTGGWQTWDEVSHQVFLKAGAQTITIKALQSGWNLNWIEFTKLV